MFKFITPVRRKYRVVVVPYKNDRDGNVLQDPKYASFEDGVFVTDNDEIAKFLRNLRNFGADFFEVEEVPKTHGYQGNSIGITQMDAKPQDDRVAKLEAQLGQVMGLLNQLVNKEVPSKIEEPKEEEKTDEPKKAGRPKKD